jgi:hypothetical protein
MLKKIAIATVLSATAFGATMLPAQAAPNNSDCAYARQLLDIGAGPQGGSSYNPYAVTVQQCR